MDVQEILSDKNLHDLIVTLDKTQWEYKPNFDLIKDYPILTREDLRNTKMDLGYFTSKSSGSTGEPVTVQKTVYDFLWYHATNTREFIWRKWDTSKNIALIRTKVPFDVIDSWMLPKFIFPNQGLCYRSPLKTISELQSWIDDVKPHYINCLPSIFKQLDMSNNPNFIDWKGTGELGGTMYSTEECGTIAIQCPDNPSVYHVMENMIVEQDIDGAILVSCLTNPYIKRYKHGDYIELGECHCGRTLQTIKKINGRVRNMFVLPNGDKRWPLIGSLNYHEQFGIKRYKAIQKSINELELQIVSPDLGDKEKELITLTQNFLETPINITIKYVDGFPEYKFEEFVSLVV